MRKTLFGFVAAIIVLSASTTTALAQVELPSQVSIQGTALVTKSTKDQTPSNDVKKTGGLLVGYSYQFHKYLGVEANYGYTLNRQNYTALTGRHSLETDFHEMTGALVAHIPVNARHVRPYALAGGGALVFNPTQQVGVIAAQSQTRGAFVYGGGANIDITNNFGVRAEYRGLLYKVPDFTVSTLDPDKFTHLAQPSVGFFFRF